MQLPDIVWSIDENHTCQQQIMIFDSIHKTAILKLLNQLTTKSTVNIQSINPTGSSLDFKDEISMFGIPVLSRIGLVIAKFERIFKPDNLTDENNCISSEDGNRFYLQDILSLINYIDEMNLYGKIEPISHATLETLQCSQHVHGLILCIREWIASFYCNKDFVVSLFPHTNDQHIFSLIDFREENYCYMSILIFSILHKFGQSFPEYYLLLDFFFTCFSNVRSIPQHAIVDNNAFVDLLLKSIVHRRDERDNIIKQIMDKQQQLQHRQPQQQQTQHHHNNQQQPPQLQSQQSEGENPPQNTVLGMPKLIGDQHLPTSQPAHQIVQSHQVPSHIVVGKQSNNEPNFQKMLELKTKKMRKNAYPVITLKRASDPEPICDQTHYCNLCQKQFATAYKLQRHNYMHSGNRPFVCTWPNCDRSFNDNYHLKRHINSHMGNKPFACQIDGCTKQYARMEDLRTHMKTHFPLGDVPYPDHSMDDSSQSAINIDLKLRSGNRERDQSSSDGRSPQIIGSNGIDILVDTNANHGSTTSFPLSNNIAIDNLQQIQLRPVIVENGDTHHRLTHHDMSSGNDVSFARSDITPVQIISEPSIPQTIILESSSSNSNETSAHSVPRTQPEMHLTSSYY